MQGRRPWYNKHTLTQYEINIMKIKAAILKTMATYTTPQTLRKILIDTDCDLGIPHMNIAVEVLALQHERKLVCYAASEASEWHMTYELASKA